MSEVPLYSHRANREPLPPTTLETMIIAHVLPLEPFPPEAGPSRTRSSHRAPPTSAAAPPLNLAANYSLESIIVVVARICKLFSIRLRLAGLYRGTSLIRNSAILGPYSRNMPMALRWS